MSYSIIQPPFTLKFREMSAKDLKDYNGWFHDVLPQRVASLKEEVRRSPESLSWEPDLTAASLDSLGAWFAGQVEVRPRTPEEVGALTGAAPWVSEIGRAHV